MVNRQRIGRRVMAKDGSEPCFCGALNDSVPYQERCKTWDDLEADLLAGKFTADGYMIAMVEVIDEWHDREVRAVKELCTCP